MNEKEERVKKPRSNWEEILTYKRFPKSGSPKYFQAMRTNDGSVAFVMGEYGEDGSRHVIKLDHAEVALLCFTLARELLR